ncbi:MAG: dihydroorotate dehydrogenase electron transfer subunit [Thermoplasmatota archaeon]
MNTPFMTIIQDSILETRAIKTISFSFPCEMIPGQFFMIWIPGVDEIPMSVSKIQKNNKSITFKKVGDATEALFQKKEQDIIGIRGPFGNGFNLQGKKQLYVGGGTGIAMLAPAIKQQFQKGAEITVILGAKQKKDIFFKEYLQNYTKNIYVTTDDGSSGYKGYASTFAGQLLQKETFDNIYTCGPEHMMNALLKNRNNTPLQASLERYMKCGIGLCGQCCIGNGQRVCKDGPIFNHQLLEKDTEFGRYKRDETGKKIPI